MNIFLEERELFLLEKNISRAEPLEGAEKNQLSL